MENRPVIWKRRRGGEGTTTKKTTVKKKRKSTRSLNKLKMKSDGDEL